MGKNGRFGKVYGKVVGKDASNRPGSKGPSFTKKKPTRSKENPPMDEDEDSDPQIAIPLVLQQLLLNVFKDTFAEVLASEDRQTLMQDVKNALYERDFARAFGSPEFLAAYTVRWSPSRALCYLAVLVDISEHFAEVFPLCREIDSRSEGQSATGAQASALQAVCLGGGAAEIVAFGGFLRYLHDIALTEGTTSNDPSLQNAMTNMSISFKAPDAEDSGLKSSTDDSMTPSTAHSQISTASFELDLVLVDSAAWGELVQKLEASIITPPPLSKYASASAKATNIPLISKNNLMTTFVAEDVLSMSARRMEYFVGKEPMLLTLLFTLNELYTSSISSTTNFLLNLTVSIKPGSFLLVVDSPGSYSETTVGESTKKYPMHWLLAHTLLDTAKSGNDATWEKVVSDDSKWFRIPEGLRYPLSLENMRYQIHLYRRL